MVVYVVVCMFVVYGVVYCVLLEILICFFDFIFICVLDFGFGFGIVFWVMREFWF